MKKKISLFTALIFLSMAIYAQTTVNGVTTFASSKTINKYTIASNITKVIIKANVTLTGSFSVASRSSSLTITGEDSNTSIIKGTGNTSQDIPNIECTSAITMYLTNFTSLNPNWFHMRCIPVKMIANGVRLIETIDNGGNNTDGFSFGDGSSFNNCYVDTWDDSFKMYYGSSCSVSNTTILHNRNGAPFQMGWGDGVSNNFTLTLDNVTVIGNSDAIYNQGVFSFAGGTAAKTRTIKLVGNGLIRKVNPGMAVAPLYVTQSGVKNKTFSVIGGACSMVNPTSANFKNIGGSTNKVVVSGCTKSAIVEQELDNTSIATLKVSPNPASDVLNIRMDASTANVQIYNTSGKIVKSTQLNSDNNAVDIKDLKNGLYFIKIQTQDKTETFKIIKN